MLLIRNGFLHPMTDAAPFRGDVLLGGGRILRVERRIDPDTLQLESVIEAEGLHVCPGLIDAHTHLIRAEEMAQDDTSALADAALAAGVTTVAVWPDGDGERCLVYHGHDRDEAAPPLTRLLPENLTDDGIRARMRQARQEGVRLAAEVRRDSEIRRLMALKAETGCDLILAHLTGGHDMIDEIAASGCMAVLGASCQRGGESAYVLAAKLRKAGVKVALTSDYPATRLHHLRLCAGLCVRAGMKGEDALRTVTIDAARLLQVDASCGSIEPGKRADLSVYDGDPLMLATDHVMTLSGGCIVT